ncbi:MULTISPECIES: M24 family metallopeptidase [Pseudonocardia]|uniref:Metallopeptidase family M24 n=2 Tax=Pseudonocardia TaxID=1847 RepID=A0A1Y2MJ07_PSEAH|nr:MULTISPECIES: M24 family metallopeptidase [Pseudonocardia]OSY35243.1 Metallopeptidase family M24 [Pseudonocardia autotrophica]TDN73156.1 metallopeptidase family M24 [Pseudonocardia autotrophica]
MTAAEQTRIDALRAAEEKAGVLFETAVGRGLIVPGATEREVSDGIRDLAGELFGIHRFWHKRIVRSGRNTVSPYRENPPDLTIAADDIVFVDFGPIFEEWEADFGRTYVVGADPAKHRLAADLPRLWEDGRRRFREQDDITGEELYRYVLGRIAEAGWEHPETHAGHLVGEFPHERIEGDQRGSYITDGNTAPLRRTGPSGRACHWILEIHIVDPAGGFGGFFEQLLDI